MATYITYNSVLGPVIGMSYIMYAYNGKCFIQLEVAYLISKIEFNCDFVFSDFYNPFSPLACFSQLSLSHPLTVNIRDIRPYF